MNYTWKNFDSVSHSYTGLGWYAIATQLDNLDPTVPGIPHIKIVAGFCKRRIADGKCYVSSIHPEECCEGEITHYIPLEKPALPGTDDVDPFAQRDIRISSLEAALRCARASIVDWSNYVPVFVLVRDGLQADLDAIDKILGVKPDANDTLRALTKSEG